MSESLLIADAALPTETRAVLVLLVALLLLILGLLVAFVVVVRRRSLRPSVRPGPEAVRAMRAALASHSAEAPVFEAGSGGGLAGRASPLKSQATEPVVCPSCSQRYAPSMRFCPADARPLVAAAELRKSRAGSQVCPHCRRGFDAEPETCPHDGCELVPHALLDATRGRAPALKPVGEIGRICPQCRRRYDLAAQFCPHDGAMLASLN